MSTCPAKDIHCLYADNELQEPFKTEFEIHTASCTHCQKILSEYRFLRAKMQGISHTAFFSNASDSRVQLEEGYARLKARLSYKRVVLAEKRFGTARMLIPAAAAAIFVFTAAFTLRLSHTGLRQNQIDTLNAVSKSRAEPMQKRGIIAPENVSASSLASMFGNGYNFTLDTPQLTAIDVFKPELSSNVNYIRIPLTDVSQMPLMTTQETIKAFDFTEDRFR